MTEIRGPTFREIQGIGSAPAEPMRPASPEGQFARALDQALATPQEVKFSRHAQERIRSRGIQITPHELDRLGQAVRLAEAKGAKGSLVVSGPLSYVVDVPARTVVTALYGEQARGHVFTNIDSAVVL